MDTIIPKALDDYCAAHTSPPSALLTEIEAWTRAHLKHPQMLTGHLEGALLQWLIRLTGARRVLEIGTFSGYSALAMAEALPADGVLITCDNNPEHARVAQPYFDRSPHGRKIALRLGPALETLAAFPVDAPFDFVFDARLPWRAPLRGALKCVQFCSRQNCLDADKSAGSGFGRASARPSPPWRRG